MAEALSPEPGSFPKRRPAALSRLTVPTDTADAQATSTNALPSCHGDAPPPLIPPLSAGRRAPRLSKPGYQAEPGYHNVVSVLSVLLLVVLASVSTYRQRQLAAVVDAAQRKHTDELNLQVEWLAASMNEHEQCKAALQRADADYVSARTSFQQCVISLHKCDTEQKQSSSKSVEAATSSRAASAQLQVELESTRASLKVATDKLQKVQEELSTAQAELTAAQDQQHVQQAQIEVLHEQLKAEQLTVLRQKEEQQRLLQEKGQVAQVTTTGSTSALTQTASSAAPLSAEAHAAHSATAVSAAMTGSTTDVGGSNAPVVVVSCSASDLAPQDMITPFCEAVVAAGVPRAMLVSDDAGCVAAAKAAGIKVLQHTFQVPAIPGALAEQNSRAYRRYAALQQVLALGHATLSVEPEVLLLSDPVPVLHQHPTDVAVMSTAWGDEHMAYGHVVPPSQDASGDSAFHIAGLSPALIYLQPQPAALAFLQAMMEGLASGSSTETHLLNTLLLPPWHMHTAQADASSTATQVAATLAGSSGGSSSSGGAEGSGGDQGHGSVPALAVPVTVGVLPPSLFTSSAAVFGAQDPKGLLKQHQPVAVQLLPGAERAAQTKAVLEWLEADIQEVIQLLGQLPEHQPEVVPVATTGAATTTTTTTPPAAGVGAKSDSQGQDSKAGTAAAAPAVGRGGSGGEQKAEGLAVGEAAQPAKAEQKQDQPASQQQQQQQQANQEQSKQEQQGGEKKVPVAAGKAAAISAGAVPSAAAAPAKPVPASSAQRQEDRKLQQQPPPVAPAAPAAAAAATKAASQQQAAPATTATVSAPKQQGSKEQGLAKAVGGKQAADELKRRLQDKQKAGSGQSAEQQQHQKQQATVQAVPVPRKAGQSSSQPQPAAQQADKGSQKRHRKQMQ